ncbi:MAG: hypothetical protein SNG49_09580, partial [Rikenellaceae bacterium]
MLRHAVACQADWAIGIKHDDLFDWVANVIVAGKGRCHVATLLADLLPQCVVAVVGFNPVAFGIWLVLADGFS